MGLSCISLRHTARKCFRSHHSLRATQYSCWHTYPTADLFTLKHRVHFSFFKLSYFLQKLRVFSFLFHFVFSENNLKVIPTWLPEKMANKPHFELPEVQFSAEATQSTIQKLTIRHWEVTRLTHVPLKTQNWAYSRLENKWTAKQV